MNSLIDFVCRLVAVPLYLLSIVVGILAGFLILLSMLILIVLIFIATGFHASAKTLASKRV